MQDGLQLSHEFPEVLLCQLVLPLGLIARNWECQQDVLGLDLEFALPLKGELVLTLLVLLLLDYNAVAGCA